MTFPVPEMTGYQPVYSAGMGMGNVARGVVQEEHEMTENNVHMWPVASPFPGRKTMLMVTVNGQTVMQDVDYDYVDPNTPWPAPYACGSSHGSACSAGLRCPGELPSYQDEWEEPSFLSASASRRRRRQRAKRASSNIQDHHDGVGHYAQHERNDENRRSDHESWKKSVGEFASRLLERLKSGQGEEAAALAQLQGAVLDLSFDVTGTRVVQLALEKADRSAATVLASELRGHVRRAIRCPHANYVVQKIVEVLSAGDSSFIAEELRGAGAQATRHPFGCRVICRFLEHSQSDEMMMLMHEILMEAGDLCRHAYGHHVMEHFLEHGQPQHKTTIVHALLQDLHRNARNRQATYVIEKALESASPEDAHRLETALASDSWNILDLAENQFGCHVVMTLLRQQRCDAAKLTQQVLQMNASRLKESKFGAKVVEELESLLK